MTCTRRPPPPALEATSRGRISEASTWRASCPGNCLRSLPKSPLSADSGSSTTDLATNVASQTVSGTLSVALGAGDVVRVSLDNGASWLTADAPAGATAFSIETVTLTGSGTLMARVENAGGVAGKTSLHAYTLDQTAPLAPTLSQLTATVTAGIAEANSTVTVFDGALVLGSAVADANGMWSLPTILTSGSHTISATATDLAGNVSEASPIAKAIVGTSGNDRLSPSGGTFTLLGGTGNDTYVIDDAGDVVREAVGEGTDTVRASVSYTLGADAEVEFLRANAGSTGLTLTGNAFSHVIVGNAGDDTLVGGAGDDTLNGGGGDDSLDGGTGADTMAGGDGNDLYYVDDARDVITEADDEGTDTVWASVSYTLGEDAEVEALRAIAEPVGLTLTGNEFARLIAGNVGDDTLIGGTGNNTLNGGAGADTMAGGDGNDIYYVDNAGDVVRETVGEGTDTVRAGVSYTLGADAEVEFLRANAGSTGLTLTGNAFSHVIVGNAGDDTLIGGRRDDTLNGGGGNDTLDGGAGADTMAGGDGNDLYYVDDAGDAISEADDEGTDTVWASVSYTLGDDAEVEFLRAIAGPTGLTLTGNAFARLIAGNLGDDTLIGGTGNNTLDGAAGADTMAGGDGNDIYHVDDAGDVVSEAAGEGNDTVWAGVSYTLAADAAVESLRANAGSTGLTLTGNAFTRMIAGNVGDDTLIGGTGNNTLDGGAGADTMAGGTGNDIYYVDNAGDVVTEAAGDGTDTVWANVSYTLGANAAVEFLRASAGSTGLTLTGNASSNAVVGGTGNDTLDGGVGADTLTGNGGNDIFRFLANSGRDTVTDFTAHAAGAADSTDLLDISFLNITAETFAANVNIAAGPGRTTMITIGADSISLRAVAPSDIDISDFRLA